MPLHSHRLLLFSALVLFITSSFGADSVVPVVDPAVRITGRTCLHDDSLVLEYPGIELVLRFSGSAVALRGRTLTGENWFNAELDGQELPVLATGNGSFDLPLAAGLDPEVVHQIRLVRRNEYWQGVVRLDAFMIEDGAPQPPPAPDERCILAIGDSITAGQGVDFIPPHASPGNHNADAGATYGWILARRLEASVHLVAFGGKGLMRDWEGSTTEIRAPDFFERASPHNPDTPWNHDRYQPHLVMVALGTNDFSTGLIDPHAYADAYVAFIERVREVHPEAKILLISSPMLNRIREGGQRAKEDVLRQALAQVVAHFRTPGEDRVRAHFVGHYPGTEWDAHPVRAQHVAIADELEPVVRAWLDW